MSIKIKPFWLRWLTSPISWVTISPDIYIPDGWDPYSTPWLIAHEEVHLKQQKSTGKWTWFWDYLTRPNFRLNQEAEAIAMEIITSQKDRRQPLLDEYSAMLCEDGGVYDPPFGDPASTTFHEAKTAILIWMERIHPRSTNGLH